MAEKAEMIDFLIENEISPWTEDDRADLEACSVGALTRCCEDVSLVDNDLEDDDKDLVDNADTDEDEDEDEDIDEAKMKKARKSKKKRTDNASADFAFEERSILKRDLTDNDDDNDVDQLSLNEHLEKMPPEYREMVEAGLGVWNQEKDRIVDFIFNHENNEFTKAWLKEQKMPVLQGLAQLAGELKSARRSNYAGAAGGPMVQPLRNMVDEEPLLLPTLNWDSE